MPNLPLKVCHWLLTSNIQIPTGPEEGAVTGWLDGDGRMEFIYPEIAGYYLTGMAFMVASNDEQNRAKGNARRAVDWLYRECRKGQALPTRRYLSGQNDDWRNHLLFAFDLAMVLRGVIAVEGLVPENQRHMVTEVLIRSLSKFCTPDFELTPFLRRGDAREVEVPVRWSTAVGPYQTKMAASLLCSAQLKLPPELRRACEGIISRWRSSPTGSQITGEWHADLYFIEGLLLLGLHLEDSGAIELAAENYRLLASRCTADGYFVCETTQPASVLRSDVVSQLLRAGCILRSFGYLESSFWSERLSTAAALLEKFISPEGSVSFGLGRSEGQIHWNSWCALFAYQALRFNDVVSRNHRIENQWLQLLI
jgi:hypothetical protein